MNPPSATPEALFHRLLDASAALLAAPDDAGIAIPEDELHREILVPLLPSMLADAAIRAHWGEQAATGFAARIARHFEGGEPAPSWLPGDFEIHVTASYSASPDARALADTLLSEDSLRDMTAALMNQLLDVLWPSVASAAVAPEPAPTAAPSIEVQPMELPSPVEPERAAGIHAGILQPARHPHSRALIRSLCGNLPAREVRRGLVANSARGESSAAVVARRILARAVRLSPGGPTKSRPHNT
jgi:hypothetical protein